VKIRFERIEQALAEDNSNGFCLNCGAGAYGVEPDARNYKCEECGRMEVYGAEEILMMGETEE
jgi:hypothetical protein